MAGHGEDIGFVAFAVGAAVVRDIQPALLAKEDAVVVLQVVQQLARRICLRQRAVIQADGIGRLAAFGHFA